MAGIARRDLLILAVGVAVVLAAALYLHANGHPWICRCGTVHLWFGERISPENSQHLFDWWTPSHIIHGFIFYFLLWLVARRLPISFRALIALLIELTWEVFENSPAVVSRYQEATISVDYFGDSVINSLSDVVAMFFGFFLARHLPVWLTVAIAIALELLTTYFVRDSLALNSLMLIYPLDAVRAWQSAI